MTERTRAYIYRVSLAAGAVALAFGLLTEDKTLALVGLASAVLNVLPTKNTSTKKDPAA